MKQRFALLLLIVNLFGTTIALWSFRIDRRGDAEHSEADLKKGIAAYLASASNPAEMQERSAEIAELLSQASMFADGWRSQTYRALKYPVILGGFNVIVITTAMGWGVREGHTQESAAGTS